MQLEASGVNLSRSWILESSQAGGRNMMMKPANEIQRYHTSVRDNSVFEPRSCPGYHRDSTLSYI